MFYLIIPKQHRWGEVGSQHSLPCLSSFTCAAPLLCRGACVLSFSTLFGNYHILLLFLLVALKLLCWASIGHKPLKQIHCIVLRTWTNKLTWSWSNSFNLPVVALNNHFTLQSMTTSCHCSQPLRPDSRLDLMDVAWPLPHGFVKTCDRHPSLAVALRTAGRKARCI